MNNRPCRHCHGSVSPDEHCGRGRAANALADSITSGLRELGIQGVVDIRLHDPFTVKVSVDGQYIGLWDCMKKTFVE